MCCWRTLSLLFLTLISLALASPTNNNFPIGISLGIDELTSAYITENGDFVTVVRVQTTQAWKELAVFLQTWDSLKRYRYTEASVKQVLTTELSSIQEATQAKLDRNIDIMGVTCPEFLTEYGYRNLLTRTASETLGYPIGTDVNQENNHLLHFDYQNRILRVSVTDVGIDTTNLVIDFLIQDFGGEGQNASPERLEYLCKRMKRLIHSLLAGKISHSGPTQLVDVRAIIFSGDAPASEFQKIREAIVEIVPEFSDRFVEGIEPRWVGAVGAARLARLYKLYPKRYEIEHDEPMYEHDEL